MERLRRSRQNNSRPRTLRDIAAAVFRRGRLAGISFGVIFVIAVVVLVLQPDIYEAEMKIVVKRGRLDPMVTADSGTTTRTGTVTDQDLSSAVELLRSRDLLEKAVADCKLYAPKGGPLQSVFGGPALLRASTIDDQPEPGVSELAVRDLEEQLQIVPLRGSNLIAASYESRNPEEAACVLNALANRYIDKHLAVHRPGATAEFFRAEAERYRQQLQQIEQKLVDLGPSEQTATGFDRLNTSVYERRAAIAGVEARIRTLEQQAATLKDRHTTEIRTRPNPRVSDLQTQLTSLRVKRAQMIQNYAPTYRPIVELDRQIQEVQQDLQEAQKTPITEESTNRDPAYEWVRLELAKARSELASLQAGTPVATSSAQEFHDHAVELEKRGMQRADLLRMAKVAEENYLLYLRKQEEGRVSEALDRQGIVNVAIAEAAMVPHVPQKTRMPLRFSLAAMLAGLMSLGIALGTDVAARTFHRPSDMESVLGIPALAAYPKFEMAARKPSKGVK